jgi:hypothetical protein
LWTLPGSPDAVGWVDDRYLATANEGDDALRDATGETVFLRLGRAFRIFHRQGVALGSRAARTASRRRPAGRRRRPIPVLYRSIPDNAAGRRLGVVRAASESRGAPSVRMARCEPTGASNG